jgi:cytochrome c5
MNKNIMISLLLLVVAACDKNGDSQTQVKTPPVKEVQPVASSPESTEAMTSDQAVEAEPVEPRTVTEEVAAETIETGKTAGLPAAQLMTGEQVFKKHCIACHMTGAANAPKVGDIGAWAPRIAKGMDALMMSALEGVPNTAMQPRGTCTTCTEQEMQEAIEFMVNQSR